MPRARSIRLRNGLNIFNLKKEKGRKNLAKLHITLDEDAITVKPELARGREIEVTVI